MNEIKLKINGKDYNATYNKQSKYYEIDLTAPEVGGIYNAEVEFTDLFNNNYKSNEKIQVFAKEKLKILGEKIFMWIFDKNDFFVKHVVELADYEINIDEETNATTNVKLLQETTANADDIVAIKKNNEIIYWGIIDNIQNENGKHLYTYTLKYITNIFNQEVAHSKNTEETELEEGWYRIKCAVDINKVLDVNQGSVENNANVQIWGNGNTSNQKWKITKHSDNSYEIKCIKSNKVLDVPEQNYTDKTSVQQYEPHGGDSQRFNIEHIEGAYYKVKTKVANFYLDVEESKTEEGTDIIIYHPTRQSKSKVYF